MQIEYAARVQVFAEEQYVFAIHAEEAARLVRDGQAVRRCNGRKVRALDLRVALDNDYAAAPKRGNPAKYTFVEALGPSDAINSHCQSLKPGIARPRNWPIYRAAIVDCLPAPQQAEIRRMFA